MTKTSSLALCKMENCKNLVRGSSFSSSSSPYCDKCISKLEATKLQNESNSSSLLCRSMRCSKYAMENKTKFYGYCNECFKQNVLKTDEIDPPVADKKDEDKYSDKNLNNQSRNNIHVREHKTVESSEKENHTNITQRISSARQREEINIPVTRNLYDKETIGHSTSDFIQPNRKQVTFFINFIKPLLLTIFCL